MNEQPSRVIGGGLQPRRATTGGVPAMDASRLLRRSRESAPPPPAAAAEVVAPPAAVPAADQPAAKRTSNRVQLNTSVPVDLRARARAAFRATAHLEGYRSFQDLITAAIDTEVRRLEAAHNGGQAFAGGTEPLPGGRPLGD